MAQIISRYTFVASELWEARTRRQFHQHFTSCVLPISFSKENQRPTVTAQKLQKKQLHNKKVDEIDTNVETYRWRGY